MRGQCDLCNHFLAEIRTLAEPRKAGMWKDRMQGRVHARDISFTCFPGSLPLAKCRPHWNSQGCYPKLGLGPVGNSIRSIYFTTFITSRAHWFQFGAVCSWLEICWDWGENLYPQCAPETSRLVVSWWSGVGGSSRTRGRRNPNVREKERPPTSGVGSRWENLNCWLAYLSGVHLTCDKWIQGKSP